MVSADANIARNATAAIQQLLLEDVQCRTALEAVQLVADLVRKRRCVLPASVVQCLLVLRFAAVTPTSQGGEGAGRAGATKNGGKAKVRVAVRVCVCALVLRGGGCWCSLLVIVVGSGGRNGCLGRVHGCACRRRCACDALTCVRAALLSLSRRAAVTGPQAQEE
jgi:hypothetical protein